MRKHTTKVQQMIDGFMEYHSQGYSISDIAKRFEVSTETIYSNLDEIAKNNFVCRDDLLDKPFTKSTSKKMFRRENVELEQLMENFTVLETEFAEVTEKLYKITKE